MMRHGAAYGAGIYLADNTQLSCSYTRSTSAASSAAVRIDASSALTSAGMAGRGSLITSHTAS
eukprot:7272628-Prymnesium_polylepis.1